MQTRLLNNELIIHVSQLFDEQLIYPVELLFFARKTEREAGDEITQLLKEVTALSDQIHLQNYDIDKNASVAQKYGVQNAPGLVVAGRAKDNTVIDYGIRLIGAPSGYEFSSLIQAIILVSKRDSGLKQDTRDMLKQLKESIHLQVFVTPT
jgi:alkyl hydroperoxide reductase subunit AhpF